MDCFVGLFSDEAHLERLNLMLASQAHLQHKHNLSRQQLTAAGYLEGALFLRYHTLKHSEGLVFRTCISPLPVF